MDEFKKIAQTKALTISKIFENINDRLNEKLFECIDNVDVIIHMKDGNDLVLKNLVEKDTVTFEHPLNGSCRNPIEDTFKQKNCSSMCYCIEKIIGEKMDEFGRKMYLIKWTGFDTMNSSWCYAENFIDNGPLKAWNLLSDNEKSYLFARYEMCYGLQDASNVVMPQEKKKRKRKLSEILDYDADILIQPVNKKKRVDKRSESLSPNIYEKSLDTSKFDEEDKRYFIDNDGSLQNNDLLSIICKHERLIALDEECEM